MELYIGQILYREIERRNEPDEIKEYVIKKIGNKYFYCADGNPINKATLAYTDKEYCQHNYQLYATKQAIFDKRELAFLNGQITKWFTGVGRPQITLEQARAIANILRIEYQPLT